MLDTNNFIINPVSVVIYERSYFTFSDNIRFTLDKNLQFAKFPRSKCVYEYSNVINKSTKPFDSEIKKKYLDHIKDDWLDGLSFNSAHKWIPGNAIIFDSCRLHCGSDFRKLGINNKLGISIFTQHK